MRRNEGFTLVELMVVVAIMGVLAALAIYGVSRYVKHSKTAEALSNLGHIETGSRAQYQRETPYGPDDSQLFVHTFCPKAPMTPSAIPAARKAQPSEGNWNTEGWNCLKFNLSAPHYYTYTYDQNGGTGTGASYTATAHGDLDGNGTTSTFELRGHGGPLGDAVRDVFLVVNEDE